MAETQLTPARAPAQRPASRPLAAAWLLGGLEWGLLLAALGLWAGSRDYTPSMSLGSGLLVGSWVLRWARTGRLTRATVLDLPLALFFVSVLAGLWAAPQLGVALPRLFLFLGALGVFYALANAHGQELRLAAFGLVAVAAGLALYFILQHDWAAAGVKFGAVRQAGLALQGLVPDLGLYQPHPNVVAGALGVSAPVALALALDELRRAGRPRGALLRGGLAALALGLILAGVIMTESRAVWVALAAAAALAAWWWLAGWLARRSGPAVRLAAFGGGLALGALGAAAALAAQPTLLTRALGSLPGPTNTTFGRLELFGQVWRLAQDTPYTGGGLGAFPALYATYILDIPFLSLTHAHNAYLNVLVEQGWLGLLTLAGLLLIAGSLGVWALAQPPSVARVWQWAGVLGLVVVAVQGLADATLVASRALPFWLVPAGLIVAGLPAPRPRAFSQGSRRAWILAGCALAAVALVAGLGLRRPWLAAWHANLGAVLYDRQALADWPSGQWHDGRGTAGPTAAAQALEEALRLDPDNRAAHFRLGLQARFRQEFGPAVEHLGRAFAADPEHRGAVKTLGYSYAWLGLFDQAAVLLSGVPEAPGELAVYEWWWATVGRRDLAERAVQMLERLGR